MASVTVKDSNCDGVSAALAGHAAHTNPRIATRCAPEPQRAVSARYFWVCVRASALPDC